MKNLNFWKGKHGPLLIAEIGGNHEGNFNYAKKLVNLAISIGVDMVKLQIYQGSSLVSPIESKNRFKHFQKFELTKEQHIEIAEICKKAKICGIDIIDIKFQIEGVDLIKADQTNEKNLKEICDKYKRFIFMSTCNEKINKVNSRLYTVYYYMKFCMIYPNQFAIGNKPIGIASLAAVLKNNC